MDKNPNNSGWDVVNTLSWISLFVLSWLFILNKLENILTGIFFFIFFLVIIILRGIIRFSIDKGKK